MSDIYYLNLIFKQRRFGVKILFEFSATPFSALQQTQLKSTVYTSGPGEERERDARDIMRKMRETRKVKKVITWLHFR